MSFARRGEKLDLNLGGRDSREGKKREKGCFAKISKASRVIEIQQLKPLSTRKIEHYHSMGPL